MTFFRSPTLWAHPREYRVGVALGIDNVYGFAHMATLSSNSMMRSFIQPVKGYAGKKEFLKRFTHS